MRESQGRAVWVLLWLVPWLAGARGCEVGAPARLKPVGAPLRLEEYGEREGGLSNEAAAALAGHEEHREEVYALAEEGHPVARGYWGRLEELSRAMGQRTAQEMAGVECMAPKELLECVVDGGKVERLVPGQQEGARRLRQVFAEGFVEQWVRQRRWVEAKERAVRAAVGLVGAVLVVGMVAKAGPAGAVVGEVEARGAVGASVAEREVAARAAAAGEVGAVARAEVGEAGAVARAEAGEAGAARRGRAAAGEVEAGGQRLLGADSLGLRGALEAEVVEALEARLLEHEAEVSALARQPATLELLELDKASLAHGRTLRVESFSCKKRSLAAIADRSVVSSLVEADARQAVGKYGGEVQVRRPTHPLFGRTVRVSKVHLVYEAKGIGSWKGLIQATANKLGVEVYFI